MLPDTMGSEAVDTSFAEICIACRDQFVHGMSQGNSYLEDEYSSSCAEPEVNLGLRKASCDDAQDGSSYAQPEDNVNLRTASCVQATKASANKKHSSRQDAKEDLNIRISLEQTLVLPDRKLDLNQQMLEWFENGSWWRTFAAPWPHDLGELPEGVHIHPATWEALHCQTWHQNDEIERIELYVDGATGEDHAGWSVVVISTSQSGDMLQGVLSGTVVTDREDEAWLGATELTNIAAEFTAMIVAQMLAHAFQDVPQIVIRPDLQLSKLLADLDVVVAKVPVMSGLCAFFTRFRDGRISVEEVRAHKHHPWNELADCIAKHAARGGQTVGKIPWERVAMVVRSRQDREWAWLQTAGLALQQTFPPVFDNVMMQIPAATVPDTIDLPSPELDTRNAVVDVKICTINILALDTEDQASHGNRALRLDQQMHERHVVIAGLQETRTLRGCRTSDHYHIFCSGGSGLKGKQHFGCEVWVHRSLPLVVAHNGDVYSFRDFKVVVAVADPRRLVLKLTGPVDIVLAALHAPCKTNQTSLEDIETWWTDTIGHLERVRASMMILCCDANAPLGESTSSQHGDVGAESMNPQGEIFQTALAAMDVLAPSTFPCHVGSHHTWRHPSGSFHRRDYVLVSQSLFASVRLSEVWPDVDLGFSHIDHYPVHCHIVAAVHVGKKQEKLAWDRKKFKDPEICEQFRREIASIPMPRWDVWIDDHNQYFNDNVMRVAKKHFLKAGPKVKFRPMLQESTRNLLAFKRQVLGCLRHASTEQYQELKDELKQIDKQLRKMVWNDQRAWYDDWVAQLDLQSQQHNSGEVYRMLQRLGKRKKSNDSGPRPLPLVCDEDGVYASNHEEMVAIWTNQFAKQEAGLKVQSDELIDLHLDGPVLSQDDLDPSMVPSLQQLATLIKKLRNGRAPGPNKSLPEILKAGGDEMCMQLLPMISKAIFHTREPLEWKSGTLVPLFKGRGNPSEASAYRCINVADCTGKIHHGWVRQFLEEQWVANQQSIQLGGRKGVGTDIAHHVIQSLLAWTKHASLATSILFLDLRAAFYSVHRGALFEGPVNDNLLVLAMKHHGILPEDWNDIRSQLERDHATQGISQHASVVLADMFSGTHFTLAGGQDKVLTCRGTRPGDPVGDLLFNMLFAIILRESRVQFLEATDFQWVGQPEPMKDIQDLPPMPSRGYLDLAYVDDASFAIFTPDPSELVHATQMIASIVHDTARLRGLDVNYGEGKTEVLVRVAGKGARATKTKLWHDMKGVIPIVTETGGQQIHAVRIYKHLGTHVQDHAAPTRESQRRVADARSAEGKLHRAFFAKRNVSLGTKKDVFRALVCSRHLFHVHTWSWLNVADIQKWEDGLRQSVAVLCIGDDSDGFHHTN